MTHRQKHYRTAIREALSLGVTPAQVAEVVGAFAADPESDPDSFRVALHQYVPDGVMRRLLAEDDSPSSPVVPLQPGAAGLVSFPIENAPAPH